VALAPRSRALLLSTISGSVLAMLGVHAAILRLDRLPGSPAVLAACAAVWAAVLVWQLVRWTRVSEQETVLAFCAGAAALAADGAWSGSPGHPALTSAGLTAVALGVVVFSSGRTAVLGAAWVGACQVVMLLLALGPSAMGWYVATSSSVVTSTVCLTYAALQQRLRRSFDDLAAVAGQDPLTGLLNRRGLAERFPGFRARTRHDERVAVVLVDVDAFKRVNDVHGHDAGDGVLVAVADVMRATAREGDLVSRQGGEELAWVCRCPSAQHAAAAAERLRAAVASAVMPHGESLTVSAGVAFSGDVTHAAPDAEALSRLLVRADAALYEAKRSGRDRVVLAPQPPTARPGHDGAPVPRVRDGGSGRAGAEGQRA